MKYFLSYRLNDKNALYKNLLQFFIIVLILNIFNFLVILIYTYNINMTNYELYRKIIIGYFFVYSILSIVLAFFYLIRGFYIAIKQGKTFSSYIIHLSIMTLITAPMLYSLFYSLLIYTFSHPHN